MRIYKFADTMNLGEIYIETFFHITAIAFLFAVVCAVALRLWRRTHPGWLIGLTFLLGIVFAYAGNSVFHHKMFVERQRVQNTVVPQSGCLTYEPSFGHLYATYTMNRVEFDRWVTTHPWTLAPYDDSLQWLDEERLDFSDPELAFATEMASNGNQLRVYFKNGTMYVSYNVM